MTYCGLDLSLTNTGVCILKEGFIYTTSFGFSIKKEDIVDIEKERIERMLWIKNKIIHTCASNNVSNIVIENYAFGAHLKRGKKGKDVLSSSASALEELGGVVKVALWTELRKIPTLLAPTSARKLALGTGFRKKDEAVKALKSYGMKFANNDESDAFILASALYCKDKKISADDFWKNRIWETT